ncbi:MAG: hypothetical protein IPJ41_04085 [Phycisphaerales bacterium]|nr:hypothetical protein [Phycisphaerales bacterium]
MSTHQHTQAVFAALLDPATDLIDLSNELQLPLTEILEIAESPQITAAIEALEKLAAIRSRVQVALSLHTAIATLERIAAQEPQTASATETTRKAAAQLLRMAGQTQSGTQAEVQGLAQAQTRARGRRESPSEGEADPQSPTRPAPGAAESAGPGELRVARHATSEPHGNPHPAHQRQRGRAQGPAAQQPQ